MGINHERLRLNILNNFNKNVVYYFLFYGWYIFYKVTTATWLRNMLDTNH